MYSNPMKILLAMLVICIVLSGIPVQPVQACAMMSSAHSKVMDKGCKSCASHGEMSGRHNQKMPCCESDCASQCSAASSPGIEQIGVSVVQVMAVEDAAFSLSVDNLGSRHPQGHDRPPRKIS